MCQQTQKLKASVISDHKTNDLEKSILPVSYLFHQLYPISRKISPMVDMKNQSLLIASAVLFNVCLFGFFATRQAQGQGQPGLVGVHVHEAGPLQQCNSLDLDTGACMEQETEFLVDDDNEEEDPMLFEMPGLDFKAYRRADISSFYQEPPGTRQEQTPSFQGQAGKFTNLSPERLDLYWDAGQGAPGNFISTCGPFASCGTSTHPEHVFFFIRPKTQEVVCSFRMKKGTSIYYCDPFIKTDTNDPSAGVLSEAVRSLGSLKKEQRELYDAANFNREFAPKYKEFTGGSEWLANFPSKPPAHHIWRADYFGQQHTIQTAETKFVKLPPESELHQLSVQEMKRNASSSIPFAEYREPGMSNITITVVSVAPRIFQIDNFLSELEVDHLLDLAYKANLQRSLTGLAGKNAHVSEVRTSRNTWIPRHSSPIMDAIIKRGADVLKIDEALLRHRTADEFPEHPNKKPINEDLQIVHYNQSQQYTAHHDFGYPDTRPNAPSRSINLCMYLNEGMEGGETAFPRWRNGHTNDAVKAVPKKGKAMIFYMRNPDGNLDDLSQHAAMPVVEGEKWFSNLWVWDPVRE